MAKYSQTFVDKKMITTSMKTKNSNLVFRQTNINKFRLTAILIFIIYWSEGKFKIYIHRKLAKQRILRMDTLTL